MHFKIIQVGSHVGSSISDPIFNSICESDYVILIEPIKEHYEKLVINYDNRFPNNRFIFINNACGKNNEKIILYQPVVNETSELPVWADEITSVYASHVLDHGLDIPVKVVACDTVTLNDIIETFNVTSLDVLCIDTEGYDYEVLEGLDLNILKPSAIFFEHKHMEGSNQPVGFKYESLMRKLADAEYELIFKDDANTYVSLKGFEIPKEYLYRE
jgi:FkbM family methyltransferase